MPLVVVQHESSAVLCVIRSGCTVIPKCGALDSILRATAVARRAAVGPHPQSLILDIVQPDPSIRPRERRHDDFRVAGVFHACDATPQARAVSITRRAIHLRRAYGESLVRRVCKVGAGRSGGWLDGGLGRRVGRDIATAEIVRETLLAFIVIECPAHARPSEYLQPAIGGVVTVGR